MNIDTIHHSITYLQSVQKPKDDFDIVSKVDSFYESAWNKLIFVVAALLTIIGVVIPLIIQYWQNKKIKNNANDLKAEIDKAILDAKSELKSIIDIEIVNAKNEINIIIEKSKTELFASMNLEMETKILQIDNKLKEAENSIYARHFQMGASFSDESDERFVMLILALEYYFLAGELPGQVEVLDILLENKGSIFKDLNKKQLEESFKYYKVSIKTLNDLMKSAISEIVAEKIIKLLVFYESLPNEPIEKIDI